MLRLNKQQQEVCQHVDGPILVLAAPGSGKTNVICHRLQFLLKEKHVPPESICVMTFTKAAARSMQERFFSLFGHSESIAMGTIHGLCYHILSKHTSQKISIINDTEKEKIIKKLLHQQNSRLILNEESVKKAVSRLSYLANHSKLQDSFFKSYQKEKEERGVMDYDDLLIRAVDLLESDPLVCALWQKVFDYYMVDEFQDVNSLQLRLLTLLSERTRNVMVVGDDDQAIYGFRGSMPGIFRGFEKLFPECSKYYLSVNYRSHKEILALAEDLIGHNKLRYKKRIESALGKGGKILLTAFKTKEQAYDSLLKEICKQKTLLKQGEQIGILFRNGYQIQEFVWYAKKQGVNLTGESKQMHPFMKEILNYVRLINDSSDIEALLAVMNHPERGLSRFLLPKKNFSMEVFCKQALACHEPEQVKRMRSFMGQVACVREYGPQLGVQYILNAMGVLAYVKENKNYFGWEKDLNIIIQLSNCAKNWETYQMMLRVALDEKEVKTVNDNQIQLLTMHSAKGLEFHTVFLPDLIDEILPGRKCVTKENLEEERRVFYVAITRAKVNLYLSYYGEKKSRFLREIKMRGK